MRAWTAAFRHALLCCGLIAVSPAIGQAPAARVPAGQMPAGRIPIPPAPAEPAPSNEITVTGRTAASLVPLVGGPDFISPMGEPFHSPDTLSGAEHWFAQADEDHSGGITLAEFQQDGAHFFARIDSDHDEVIGPTEIERYERDIVPEIHVISTYGDPSKIKVDSDGKVTDAPYPERLGAGRYGFLAIPEPITYADTNLDRGVTLKEFTLAGEKRFKLLDANGDGAIVRDELPKLRPPSRVER
ncbi:hypothetical protein [Sphingomonas profundi]|uniref:hypothetical protein n=1 Tax=Alterirhizorhabdus profundi TaxID=2681549 RepID=UPI0018D0A804|nr:hypothetical protein [Sphingomonas profundi]